MDQIKIGRFIAEKRKEKGMTQRELAEQLGIGDKAVSKWECGRGMPDNSIMLPLCGLLGINVNELLSGETLSETNYNERTEDIIMALMEEKEVLKKDNKIKGLFACIFTVLLLGILIILTTRPITNVYIWLIYLDPTSLIMDLIIVLIMLIVTGNVKAFFSSFRLLRKKNVEADADSLFFSLQAVKLAITSFLMGGGFMTILDIILVLNIMGNVSITAVAVSFITMLYGILFAFLLLPIKYRLEAKIEMPHK